MGKIARMSPHLANMIAAGEVVERPSSVVKELVENAIDAGATMIQVFLQEGGLSQIKIVDNGEGMDKEDVLLAFLPHATSKIKTEYDLFRISSLGFRGEAIASIAAVSTMQIISSQNGQEGYQVTYRAGIKQNEGVTHANKGTTVMVDGLFFNTPARLKYLKPAKSELASISYFMDRIALAHPEIRFQLVNDQRTYLATTASMSYPNLIGEIYGLEAAKNIVEKSYVSDGYEAHLVLVKPQIYRSNKLEMTFIVNGRYVKNYAIQNAIVEGYSTLLPIGKYPICVLYLTIDPMLVDVNVHPSKTEIKLSTEDSICEKLVEEIKEAFESTSLIPNRTFSPEPPKPTYQKTTIFEMPQMIFKEEPKAYESQEKPTPTITPVTEEKTIDIEKNEPVPVKEEKTEQKSRLPYLEYAGQVFGTYLIFQNSEGLYLLDQHAAAERINYEKYYEILGRNNQPTTELLLPLMISFTKSEAMFVESHLAAYQKIGFVLEPMAHQDFIVRQIPLWAKLDEAEDLVQQVLTMLTQKQTVETISFRDAIAKQISCKASIKANHALNRDEIDSLMDQLKNCQNPFTCPHGRPTFIRFSITEIEKMFERIQK